MSPSSPRDCPAYNGSLRRHHCFPAEKISILRAAASPDKGSGGLGAVAQRGGRLLCMHQPGFIPVPLEGPLSTARKVTPAWPGVAQNKHQETRSGPLLNFPCGLPGARLGILSPPGYPQWRSGGLRGSRRGTRPFSSPGHRWTWPPGRGALRGGHPHLPAGPLPPSGPKLPPMFLGSCLTRRTKCERAPEAPPWPRAWLGHHGAWQTSRACRESVLFAIRGRLTLGLHTSSMASARPLRGQHPQGRPASGHPPFLRGAGHCPQSHGQSVAAPASRHHVTRGLVRPSPEQTRAPPCPAPVRVGASQQPGLSSGAPARSPACPQRQPRDSCSPWVGADPDFRGLSLWTPKRHN